MDLRLPREPQGQQITPNFVKVYHVYLWQCSIKNKLAVNAHTNVITENRHDIGLHVNHLNLKAWA